MDNCVMVRHVFIMERLALMIYSFILCIGVVHGSGAVVYSMGVYVIYQQCVFFTFVKSLLVFPSFHPLEWNRLGQRGGYITKGPNAKIQE